MLIIDLYSLAMQSTSASIAQDRTHWQAATRRASTSLEEDSRMRHISACESRHRAASVPVTDTGARNLFSFSLCTQVQYQYVAVTDTK
jgi:hypothetical protein